MKIKGFDENLRCRGAQFVLSIPNFDAAVFEEITGIRV